MQGFIVLSDILQAVKCQATSSATSGTRKPYYRMDYVLKHKYEVLTVAFLLS